MRFRKRLLLLVKNKHFTRAEKRRYNKMTQKAAEKRIECQGVNGKDRADDDIKTVKPKNNRGGTQRERDNKEEETE